MHKISISLPSRLTEIDVAFIGEALADLSSAYSALRENNHHKAPWVVEWLVDSPPNTQTLEARWALTSELYSIQLSAAETPSWKIELVPDINWLEHSYKQFPPFSIGSFFIYGAHYKEEIPAGQIPLQIEAATAFGSGEHGTTKGCLLAMLRLQDQGHCPWNVLDMGTGSGILAIAAWKLWKTPVLAIDNDEEARRMADKHRALNAVPTGKTEMQCVCGEGFKTPEVQSKKPFDLIIANILAGPLMEMAPALSAVCDENGIVILSGILNERSAEVQKAYEAHNLHLKHKIEIDGWSTLTMQNNNQTKD